jgi:hypothetical protein
MARAELGRGRGGMDTINLYGVTSCPDSCTLTVGDKKFRCIKQNGDATIVVKGGVTKNTVADFTIIAPCMKK